MAKSNVGKKPISKEEYTTNKVLTVFSVCLLGVLVLMVVQRLLDCAGYGPAARLQGIYTCSYSDAASIPKESLGYAAIAQALGLMDGRYEGSRTATRGELAAMLCRLLGR